MKKRMISVLLALCLALCVGIPAAGAITEEDMANAPELALWEEAESTIATGGAYVYFKILPEETCTYTMYSIGSKDTMGYLYDAGGTQLASNDDGGEGYNFQITQSLTGGETYYLGITLFSGTGSFTVVLDGHNIEAWTTVTEPTCTDPGEETGTCSNCGASITREIPPLGHDWGIATSNNNGTHTHTCNRCHITETEPCTYEEHTEGGFTTHTCTECGYSYTYEVSGESRVALWDFEEEPTDWTFVDADGDGYNWEWYSTTSAYEGDYVLYSASYINGTGALSPDNWAISPAFSLIGTDSAELSLWVRDSNYDDIIALYAGISTDVNSMTKISDDISPTSSFVQYTADLSDFAGEPIVYIAIRHYNCTDQYYVYVDYVEVSATFIECTGHVLVEVPAAEATCTEAGHIAYWECENCGRMFYDEDGTEPAMPGDVFNLPALGHDWGEAVSNDNGTHTYTCDRCHETRTEDCTFETHSEDDEIVAVCTECGYTVTRDLVAYWDFEKEPVDWFFLDGDGDGYNWEWVYSTSWYSHGGSGIIHSASYYGGSALNPMNLAISPAFSLAEYTDAMLSLWARGQDTTYNQEVFAIYACTSYELDDLAPVSEDYTTDGEYREYLADLSAFVGEPVVHIVIVHYNVTDMFWLNVDDVSISGAPIDPCEAGNHSMTYVPAKEPTETEDGNIAYYVCEVCGLFYLDENGTQPVSAADVILPGGYDVTVDENIEHGTVVTLLTRAKEGALVPLYVNPDQGAVLTYLAYIDEDGRTTSIVTDPKAKEAVPGSFSMFDAKPDVKPAARADVKTDANADVKADAKADAKSDAKADAKIKQPSRSDASIHINRGTTEIEDNYFTMPASAVTVTAEFGPKYTITLDPGDARGDLLYITSLDEGVWAENYSSADYGQFFVYSGSDAFIIPDCPFTWTNHTFVNWLLVLGEQSAEANPGAGYYANDYTLIAQWEREPIADGYYLIGPDWTIDDVDPANVFEVNPDNSNEYMLRTTLAVDDEIKVVHIANDAIDAWYPDGMDNQYHVDAAHAGSVTIYFATSYNSAWSEFGGYFYIESYVPVPEFVGQSLLLTGQIGLRFYMDLSNLTDEMKTDSYMSFAVEGADGSIRPLRAVPENDPYDEGHKSGDYYYFTCKVRPAQLATRIIATYHYGNDYTVSKTYAVEDYFVSADEHPDLLSDKDRAVVNAMADYGYYTQQYLVSLGKISTEDPKYVEITRNYADSYDLEAVKSAVSDYAMVKTNNSNGDVEDVLLSLTLEDQPIINVYFKTAEGYQGDIVVKQGSKVLEGEVTDYGYRVQITDVSAHLMGKAYTLTATTANGVVTAKVSVLSYLNSLLNGEYTEEAGNWAAATYYYYQAAYARKYGN